MTQYIDLTKLFIRSLKINKSNKKKGKFFFYSLILFSIIFIFIPILLIYTIFVYETIRKLNDVDFAVKGFEALLFIVSLFSFVFGFNSLLNELYFSEDIENILPLPIKPEILVASKFTSSFIFENIILFLFLLLGVGAYIMAVDLPIFNLIISLLGIVFLPMIPMVYCALLLFIVINLLKNYVSTKTIKKIGFSFLVLLICLIFFLLWKLSSFNFEEYLENFAGGDYTFLNVMSYIFPSIHFFALGLNEGSIIYIVLSIVISLIYFGIMLIVSKKYYYDGVMGIFGKDTESKKSSYKNIKEFKVRKPIVNYFIKDIKFLFRSPTFFINSILINIIWPVLIFLIFRIALPDYTIEFMRNAVANQDSTFYFRMLLLVLGVSIFLPTFNSIAASSFSREGKSFHFIKYIPIKYGLQWREKYFVSFIVSFVGIIFYSLPFFIIIHLPLLKILLYILLITLCISFVSLIGLLFDSSFPKLIWDDETDSLRENFNSFITMGYSLFAFGVICGSGYYILKYDYLSISQFTIISLLILIILNLALYYLGNNKISRNIINQEC